MKARDQLLIDTLRSALSALKYKKVETGIDVTDEESLAVLQKQVKQRNDSISEFSKAGRNELVEKETKERDILMKYLPSQKSEDEIRAIVLAVIAELPADGRNQGSVMKAVMPKLKGLADGNVVKKVVTDTLSS